MDTITHSRCHDKWFRTKGSLTKGSQQKVQDKSSWQKVHRWGVEIEAELLKNSSYISSAEIDASLIEIETDK